MHGTIPQNRCNTALNKPVIKHDNRLLMKHSRGFKGGGRWGTAAPYWLRIFSKSLFPCERHTVRCVHL